MTLTRAAILAGLIGLALLFAAREQIWVILAGPADQGAVDFANITRSGKPNDFLMCPKDLCADADAQAPVFPLSADELRAALHASLQNEPHLTRMDETTSAERYVQKTALMRFPDTISVRFIALSATTSTIAIYSRSRLGYSDLGVNKARVERWVAALSEQNP
jgi:uncharacterized protein (DUF1499 family)